MQFARSRRSFLRGMGSLAMAAAPGFPAFSFSRGARIQFGYTAMTWGKQERQAIEDISALGYPGIQFRADALTDFQPAELRDLLEQHHLTFVALSSGEVSIDPAVEKETIATQLAHAKFVHDAGGLYLQVLDELKPYPRTVKPDECERLGKMLTEIGRRTADAGVPLGYHNHMNTISEHPANLDRVLNASDSKYVKLELDTAHFVAGGGDPAKAIQKYRDRLLFLHLKDVVDIPLGSEHSKYPFKFVELGRGRVDLPAVFAALDAIKYKGWAVVELDRVTEKSRTPKESAMISKQYLEDKMGVRV